MKVYLIWLLELDGSELHSIYPTKELAESAKSSLNPNIAFEIYIEEWQVRDSEFDRQVQFNNTP